MSVCLYKYLSQYPSVYTNICHSIRLLIQTSVTVSVFLYKHLSQFDIHISVHHEYIFKLQPKNAAFLDLFISTDALHVSGGSSAHHQEHINVHTASRIVNQYCCYLLVWMRWSHLIHTSSQQQYWLTIPEGCIVQFCAADDGGGTAWDM